MSVTGVGLGRRAWSIERIGAMPVPVATNSRRRSGYSRSTNVPAGPRKLTESPDCNENRNVEPGPPGTRFKSRSMTYRFDGGDAIEYGRVTGNGSPGFGTSNETNCPA